MSIVIDKSGPDGNAFAIMGHVKRTLRQLGKEDRWDEAQEAMMAGDYDHLCETATAMTDGVIEFVN